MTTTNPAPSRSGARPARPGTPATAEAPSAARSTSTRSKSSASRPKKPKGASPDPVTAVEAPIRARATRFDLSETPMHWIPGDPQSTHTANVLHLFLPPGERWFVDVFRDALPLITDPELRDQVRGFIAQEATHAKAHDHGLDFLAGFGVDLRPQVAWFDRKRASIMNWRRKLPSGLVRQALLMELSLIAAIEHYTTTLGHWIVEGRGMDDAGADPNMMAMLRWHGAEEVEHGAVAFDLFQHLNRGGLVRRYLGMAVIGPGLVVAWSLATDQLLRMDRTTKLRFRVTRNLRAGGAGRTYSVVDLLRAMPTYLRPGFHPSQAPGRELALAYLAEAPGVIQRRAKAA